MKVNSSFKSLDSVELEQINGGALNVTAADITALTQMLIPLFNKPSALASLLSGIDFDIHSKKVAVK